jgi:hypothetical protein
MGHSLIQAHEQVGILMVMTPRKSNATPRLFQAGQQTGDQ